MKTLILYASKYGFAEECANKLVLEFGEKADVINAEKNDPPSLDGYDAVIIGGSIYMGQLQKKLKAYMEGHKAELASKKLGLFLCSGLPENADVNFAANYPKELLDAAVSREYFGGVLNKSKMSVGHKLITKMMESVARKDGNSGPEPRPQNIKRLAEAMN